MRFRILSLTLLILATPMIVAWLASIWFHNSELQPTSRTSVGNLVVPQVFLPEQLHNQRKWQAMTLVFGECDADCETRLVIMHKVHQALGREYRRGSHAVLLVDVRDQQTLARLSQRLPELKMHEIDAATLARLAGENPQLPRPEHLHVWLVDPLGYAILHYDLEHTGNNLLIDWRKLLKQSQVG